MLRENTEEGSGEIQEEISVRNPEETYVWAPAGISESYNSIISGEIPAWFSGWISEKNRGHIPVGFHEKKKHV